jgi:hypothetical protein
MHAIVEWLDEDPPQVSVVPQTWITNIDDTTHCYWPPQNIAKRLKRKDFETHQLPVPDENWSTHRIRCLRVEGSKTSHFYCNNNAHKLFHVYYSTFEVFLPFQ